MAKKQIATFLGPNKGLSIVGSHSYAYSGVVNIGNSETDMLDFQSEHNYMVCTWYAHFNQPTADPVASEDFRFILYLNGNQIAMTESPDSHTGRSKLQDIIIPPNTNVKVTGRNYSGSTTEPCGVVITGKIHNA